MTAPARKYAFDTVFDANGAVVREGARTKSFTIEEMEAERAAAYAQGRDDETARAQRQVADAAAAIANAANAVVSRLVSDREATVREAAALALVAARAAAGAALDQFGPERIAAALDAAFDGFVGAPRVIVRVAPALAELRTQIEETARQLGFDGALVVRADPAVRAGDVTIDWGEGSIAHDSAEAFQRIETLVTGALSREGHGS